jgi:hypothetical protein
MKNVALKLNHTEASYEAGTVTAVEDREIVVHTDRGDRRARRAASCLVAPAVGDEVALITTAVHRAFVIAILVAAEDRAVEIAVDGDLSISARGGSCRITASDGVELHSEGTLSLLSKVLHLRAEEGGVVLSKLTLLASSLLGHLESARLAATSVETFFEHVTQTAKSWHRKVDDLDTLRAGHVDYRTDAEMCLRSENFLVGARNLAKIDAEQIHIG